MRLALAIEGGFNGAWDSFTVLIEPATARVIANFTATDLLVLPLLPATGDIGLARLVGLEADAAGHPLARLAAVRRFGRAADFASRLGGPFPLQLLSDDDYSVILAAAESETFTQPDATPAGGMADFSVGFAHVADPDAPPVTAVLETLRRETSNLCALTGAPLVPEAIPTAIRWEGPDRLHVNNLLLLSPSAEQAFREGHFTIRDDLSIIVDFRRIDPELLELINPDGRLLVPQNPALRPAPVNLAWHRRHIFRLA